MGSRRQETTEAKKEFSQLSTAFAYCESCRNFMHKVSRPFCQIERLALFLTDGYQTFAYQEITTSKRLDALHSENVYILDASKQMHLTMPADKEATVETSCEGKVIMRICPSFPMPNLLSHPFRTNKGHPETFLISHNANDNTADKNFLLL